MNIACPICQEIFLNPDNMTVTRCGHIFHTTCISRWLNSSLTCPSCRSHCLNNDLVRVYANVSLNDTLPQDSHTLHVEVVRLKEELQQQKLDFCNKTKDNDALKQLIHSQKNELQKSKSTVMALECKYSQNQTFLKILKDEISKLKAENKLMLSTKKELNEMKQRLESLESIQNIVQSTQAEVDNLLKNKTDATTLARMVGTLKRELSSCETKKNDIRISLKNAQRDCQKAQKQIKELYDNISSLESDKAKLIEDLKAVQCIDGTNRYNWRDDRRQCDADKNVQTTDEKKQKKSPKYSSPSTESASVSIVDLTDSPYLNIVSSNVGMVPLMPRLKRSLSERTIGSVSSKEPNLTEEFSIFKKPRLLRNPRVGQIMVGDRKENLATTLKTLRSKR